MAVTDYLCFTANTAGSTIELIKVGSPSIANTYYSRNKSAWFNFTPSTTSGTNTITLTNIGDKVYFKNDITGNFDYDNHLNFIMSGSISASGNINSIYSSSNFNTLATLSYEYCYDNLFTDCTSLTTPPELPSTTLAQSCYEEMFKGCTSLTTVPNLPATYCSSSYNGMFYGCTSLIINDSATTEAFMEWNLPTSGTMIDGLTAWDMLTSCAGTHTSDNIMLDEGDSRTYYVIPQKKNIQLIKDSAVLYPQTKVANIIDYNAPVTRTNISVSGTPSALSSYCAWDTQNKYGYYLDVTISGLTANSMVENIIMTDTIQEACAYVITTSANALRLYFEDNTAVSGTIYTLITSEVA